MSLQPETREQMAVIQWARLQAKANPEKYPGLDWLHCSLNGVKLTAVQARIAKAMGMKAGISDLFLPVKRGEFSGLVIEMKAGKNKPTQEQLDYLNHMASQGFAAMWCAGAVAAIDTIKAYYEADAAMMIRGR